ncbi:EI24 domain-containing protein [Magnetospirillum sp. UT-4]|uniref:EI24 domain-containing protein n=1 Tax=Magnetospirillum sp. UT-4 TaxID=2681467 RepID=UPI001385AEDA|nr:EI24 domain-containing protein [Magnetospirillum sp. UT-4]CAA7622012.1 conserved membrane hypothetical protein [Magnetospirillum sp. UT-4]
MIAALFKAFAQLPDPRLRRVLALGILVAIAAYVVLVAAVWTTLANVSLFQSGWLDLGSDLAIGLAALVLPVLFFPALSTTVMGTMLERVADAVEDRHYPGLNWPRPQGLGEVLATTLRFLALTIAVNLAALPVYLVLLLTGLTVLLAAVINGYLLGREYFDLVALRRLPPAEARRVFRHHLGRLWLAGIVIAILFGVPLLNLATPVLATAFMVHVFQSLRIQAETL